ncbi:hypothetical protein SprV_0301371000 [Sparganum proliferum]
MTSPYLRSIPCPQVPDVSVNNAGADEDESESSVKVRTQITCPARCGNDYNQPTTISLNLTINGSPVCPPGCQPAVTASEVPAQSISYQPSAEQISPVEDVDGRSGSHTFSFAPGSMRTPSYNEDNMHAEAEEEEEEEGEEEREAEAVSSRSFRIQSQPRETETSSAGRGGSTNDVNERNFQSMSQMRRSTVSSRRTDRSKSKVFSKIDEAEEAEEMRQGQSTGQSMYGGSRGRQSRYTKVYNEHGENAHERSLKITPAARKILTTIYETLKELFEKLSDALENVVSRNFRPCEEALEAMEKLHGQLDDFIKSLRYSPFEVELKNINGKIAMLIDELEVQPPFLLLRLVEFGFYIYEFGTWIREKLLPTSYALLIHTIQTRIYRLHTGRVVRQIYYVPFDFDPIVAHYAKSRRLIKIEKFCHCRVILLPPTDPRCGYCPNNYRTIEVNFDEHKGHYLGFTSLLNQCATSKIYTARLAATVFKRLSGIEVEMEPADMIQLERSEARLCYAQFKADLVGGTGLALAPKIDSV